MSTRPDRAGGVRQRRRLDVVLLLLAAVVVGAVTAGVAAASGGERVVELWVGATVADDGSARITEVIDWNFGPADRHGIVRDVPGLRTSAPVEVSSPDAPRLRRCQYRRNPADSRRQPGPHGQRPASLRRDVHAGRW